MADSNRETLGRQVNPGPLVAFAALALAGCSLGAISDLSDSVSAIAPANYKQLVADGSLAKSLRGKPTFAPLEISELRRTILSQPGDWMACLRTSESGSPLHYSIFFKEGAIVDSRLSVIIDNCGDDFLTPLPPALPPPAPAK